MLVIIVLKNHQESKIKLHTACGYLLFTHCSFDASKNKLDYYRKKDCAKMFCKDSRKHAVKIIGCGKNEMVSLTINENK